MQQEDRIRIVIEECNGIIPHFEQMYKVLIRGVADRACSCIQEVERLANAGQHSIELAWLAQEFVSESAKLSRYFWPAHTRKGAQGRLHAARGARLRELFEVSEDSPLRSRSIRDALEHFDERVDLFFLEFRAGRIAPQALIVDLSDGVPPELHLFCAVDPASKRIHLLGETFEYEPIEKAVWEILETARGKTRDGVKYDFSDR